MVDWNEVCTHTILFVCVKKKSTNVVKSFNKQHFKADSTTLTVLSRTSYKLSFIDSIAYLFLHRVQIMNQEFCAFGPWCCNTLSFYSVVVKKVIRAHPCVVVHYSTLIWVWPGSGFYRCHDSLSLLVYNNEISFKLKSQWSVTPNFNALYYEVILCKKMILQHLLFRNCCL